MYSKMEELITAYKNHTHKVKICVWMDAIHMPIYLHSFKEMVLWL